MLMQLAAGFLAAAADPPTATLAPVIEWCARGSSWSATEVVTGGYSWSMQATLTYVPTPRTIYVYASLCNLVVGYRVSLYLPVPYACVALDASTSFPIVDWVDPALGWLHASVVKPPGIPWPEAIEAGAVVLLVQ